MKDPQTGNVLVFNGEIYNYVELRSRLKAEGVAFTTDSDTEVILKAYTHWGKDCLNELNGMWAFALWDASEQHLFCARDRYGIKPFVYAHTNEGLLFASESKALLAAAPQLRRANEAYTCHFVETGEFAATQPTFYQGIDNLLPGHAMVVSYGQKPSPYRYTPWQPARHKAELTDAEVDEQFEALLADAIKLRFRSDVPVGVCLSGGLDSSAIAAMATEAFGPTFPVFSCVYPDEPSVDESEYIYATANKLGLTPVTTTVQPTHLLDLMRQNPCRAGWPDGHVEYLIAAGGDGVCSTKRKQSRHRGAKRTGRRRSAGGVSQLF